MPNQGLEHFGRLYNSYKQYYQFVRSNFIGDDCWFYVSNSIWFWCSKTNSNSYWKVRPNQIGKHAGSVKFNKKTQNQRFSYASEFVVQFLSCIANFLETIDYIMQFWPATILIEILGKKYHKWYWSTLKLFLKSSSRIHYQYHCLSSHLVYINAICNSFSFICFHKSYFLYSFLLV